MTEWAGMLLGLVALAIGGVLKGATGIGAPMLAVPLLSILYGVPTAVALFALPNLVLNGLQAREYFAHLAPLNLILPLALAGMAGTWLGVWVLVNVPEEGLYLCMSLAVFAYLGLRFARPDWVLPVAVARKVAAPVGLVAGAMFGAVGISAPVSVTFLSAQRLGRATFVATISTFFFILGVAHVPLLIASGIMTASLAIGSALAILPIWLGMPLGARLARGFSADAFDRLARILIGLIGVRMLYQAMG